MANFGATMTMKQFDREVRNWATQYPKATYNGLQDAAKAIEKEATKNYSGGVVRSRSGKLARSAKRKVTLRPLEAKVFVEPKQQYKAQALEHNTFIRARRKPYLVFRIGDQWIKTKSVVNPPKPSMGNAYNKYEGKIADMILKRIMAEVYGG